MGFPFLLDNYRGDTAQVTEEEYITRTGVTRVTIRGRIQEKKRGMIFLVMVMGMLLCSLLANAYAAGCGAIVIYNGKGAGQVVFDGKLHAAKKNFACSDCHEGTVFSFALFEMKRGANAISMRNMELGRYCGYCHDGKQAFSTTDSLSCSKCHQNK